MITAKELQRLNTRENAAIAYRGKVYDVTGFLGEHPGGGDQLLMVAGRDVTYFFDSYHGKKTRALVARKCKYIGDLEGGANPEFLEKDELYETLEKRIHDYFKTNNIDPKTHIPFFCASSAASLSTILLWCVAVLSFYCGHSLLVSASFALLSGFTSALAAFAGHDISHFSWTHKPWAWKLGGFVLYCVHGLSPYVWGYQHVVGHHVHPNHDQLDPDVATKKTDFWRIKPFQEWLPHYRYQHIYMPFMFTLLSIKMKFQDFHSMMILKKANVPINPPSAKEILLFLVPKFVLLYYRVVLPYLYISLPALLLLNLLSEAVMGFWLGIITQVSHVNADAAFPNPESSSSYNMTWSKMQISTTADYAMESTLWNFLSGGLNNQVLHHLFPGILPFHFRKLTPILRRTCSEFGVQYHSYSSLWEIWCSHTQHLKNLGQAQHCKDI